MSTSTSTSIIAERGTDLALAIERGATRHGFEVIAAYDGMRVHVGISRVTPMGCIHMLAMEFLPDAGSVPVLKVVQATVDACPL